MGAVNEQVSKQTYITLLKYNVYYVYANNEYRILRNFITHVT